jgi:hypothetical protein
MTEIKEQNGYGAFKRGEHCKVCFEERRKVGTFKVTHDDGTVEFFCADHVPQHQP